MDQARRRVRPCRVPAAGACEPRRVRVGEHGRRGVGLRVEEPAIAMAQVECASGVKSIEPARRSILSSPRAVVRRPRERRGTAAYPSGNGIERGPGTHVMCRSRASAVTMPQPNPRSARSVASRSFRGGHQSELGHHGGNVPVGAARRDLVALHVAQRDAGTLTCRPVAAIATLARDWPRKSIPSPRVRCLGALVASRRTAAPSPEPGPAGPASTKPTPFARPR